MKGRRAFTCKSAPDKDFANANRSVSSLKTQGLNAEVVAQPTEEIVRVGPVPNFAEATALQIRLIHSYPGAAVVP